MTAPLPWGDCFARETARNDRDDAVAGTRGSIWRRMSRQRDGMMEQEAKHTELSLDRPLLPRFAVKWETVFLLLIVFAVLFTRFWDLGNRSYGHDESIHAWEAWKLATGQGYRHDPVYHGPFGYHVVAFVFTLLGINDVTARIAPALFGVALVLLVLLLRRWLGRPGTLLAMFLLTISPTMMYRSRYFRHDIWLLVASLLMVIGFFHYLEERKERWLYIIAGALAVGMASKAISFMYGAIFGSFWVIYLLVEWVQTRRSLKELPAFDIVLLLATLALPLFTPVVVEALGANPLDYSQAGMTRSTVIVLGLLAISAGIGWWWNRKVWLVSAGIYYAIFILFYTTLFTNARGLATGMVGMLGYWLSQQEVARGGQPWYYFYVLNLVYEFLPSLLTGLGAVYLLLGSRRKAEKTATKQARDSQGLRDKVFVAFLMYWTVTTFLIWTWAAEKMPWQNMHVVLPLGLVSGWFLGKVWETTDWRKLLQQGLVHAMVLLPVAIFSLIVLLSTIRGPSRPFSGMALEQLEVTLRWLLSLILLGIAVGMLYHFARGLGRAGWGRVLLSALFVVLAVLTVRSALTITFVNQDYATELLVYADSTPDTGAVTRELEELSRRIAGEKELRVAYDDESSWPFVWYLRDFKNSSFFAAGGSPASDAQVVIVGPGNES
ncbi:MAG: TIGR03663 family protein, partial [Chloroflexi bacterium]|nr:TIGR03663 family protein [Chloroflexota bacterium]